MIIIFEVEAQSIKKKTFYDYCHRHGISYFKDIQENKYYARLDTDKKKENGELVYILLRKYLTKREISFTVFFSSMESD